MEKTERIILTKLGKEVDRIRKKLFFSGKKQKLLEENQNKLTNLPYEIYDKITNSGFTLQIPKIKSAEQTLDKIFQENCSLSRFGDGEFSVMNLSRIHFQNPSPALAAKLKEVIASDIPNLLIGLPDCFGTLDNYVPSAVDFWRKWMSQKRQMAYSYLDMDRVYYNAFFTRPYMIFNKTEEHQKKCGEYFSKVRKIWTDRDVVICEGEGTRFGIFNDLLDGATSISRILCPARNAFDKYDEILSAFNNVDRDTLVLIALGPTATVLAFDLCRRFQAIDIGHLDVEYEFFLNRGLSGAPQFKYYEGSGAGRKVVQLEDPEYKRQIIKRIV